MKEKLYCEKCGSEDVVKIYPNPDKESEKRVSISDFQGPSMMTTLEYRLTTMTVKCNNCGNSKSITY